MAGHGSRAKLASLAIGLLVLGALVAASSSTAFATIRNLTSAGSPVLPASAIVSGTASFGTTFPGMSNNAASISPGILAAVAMAAAGTAALIVQNKGGGHGEIGYHLALNLAKEKGMKVTMINDSAAKTDKPPFNSYSDLEAAGVEIKWADLAAGGLAGALSGVAPCDYVFDNQNVCPKDVQKAVAAWRPQAYAYVSSGGMYKPVGDGPLLETGAVKEDNKQLSIERHAASLGLNWSAFRPQYIYGPKTNKRDYIDWFLDRITRGVPIPLPVDGTLRTTLTNAKDVAGMLASVVGNSEKAKGQVFNCGSDLRHTHREIVATLAKVTGQDVAKVMKTVVCYDPAKLKGLELPKKGKFPFRETHFGVGVDKAKDVLGWSRACDLEDDLEGYYAEYLRLGKGNGDIVREWDVAVLNAL